MNVLRAFHCHAPLTENLFFFGSYEVTACMEAHLEVTVNWQAVCVCVCEYMCMAYYGHHTCMLYVPSIRLIVCMMHALIAINNIWRLSILFPMHEIHIYKVWFSVTIKQFPWFIYVSQTKLHVRISKTRMRIWSLQRTYCYATGNTNARHAAAEHIRMRRRRPHTKFHDAI